MLALLKTFRKVTLLSSFLLALVNSASAADGDLDPSFDPGKIFNKASQGYAVAVASDGKFYVSGDFVDVDNHATRGVVRFNADGSVDTSFSVSIVDSSSPSSYAPTALTIQDDNKLLIGGRFTEVNGVAQSRLARLNTDGSLDTSFTPVIFASAIETIVLDSSQRILVGGSISDPFLGGIGLVRLNAADGSVDMSFTIQSIGTVLGIVINADNSIVIGGGFTQIDGQDRFKIAKLTADGDLVDFGPTWSNVTIANSSFPNIFALSKDANNKIVIGGRFSSVNGEGRTNIARIDANGVLDMGFNPTAAISKVNSLAINSLGQIAVGVGSNPNPFLVINDDGTVNSDFATGDIGFNVFGVAWQAINLQFKPLMTLLGEFSNPDNSAKGNLVARRNPSGEVDSSFIPNAFVEGGFLSAVAEDRRGRILVGGTFQKLGDSTQPFLVRLRIDGRIDTSFNVELDSSVSAISVLPSGKIVIGGFFTNVNGVAKNRIAQLNSNGSLDANFTATASGPVYEIHLLESGQLLVGGQFASMNGEVRGSFAKLDSDGSLTAGFPDLAFDIESLLSSATVKTIRLDANSNILVGGNFTKSNDIARFRFARFSPSGILDATLAPEFKGSGNSSVSVEQILIQPTDQKLVFVGSFTEVNGSIQQYVARLDANSGNFDAFDPDASDPVNAALLQADSKFLLASQIDSQIGGEVAGGVARILANGNLDESFDAFPDEVAITDNTAINKMIFTADGKVVVVGNFLRINNQFRPAIAKLETGLPPLRIIDDSFCVPIITSQQNLATICL